MAYGEYGDRVRWLNMWTQRSTGGQVMCASPCPLVTPG